MTFEKRNRYSDNGFKETESPCFANLLLPLMWERLIDRGVYAYAMHEAPARYPRSRRSLLLDLVWWGRTQTIEPRDIGTLDLYIRTYGSMSGSRRALSSFKIEPWYSQTLNELASMLPDKIGKQRRRKTLALMALLTRYLLACADNQAAGTIEPILTAVDPRRPGFDEEVSRKRYRRGKKITEAS
jgi:hypothetical protein